MNYMTETIIDQNQIRQERVARNQRLYELGALALNGRQLQEIAALQGVPDGNTPIV